MKDLTKAIIAAVLAGTLLIPGGCSDLKHKGRQITFVTVSREAGTKTVYGDDVPGTTTYQYINWVVNDGLRVVSDFAARRNNPDVFFADYVVTEVRDTLEHHSKASIVATSPGPGEEADGLSWDNEHTGSYTFYAVNPRPGTGAVKSINCDPAPDGENPSDEAIQAWRSELGKVEATLPATVTLPSTSTKKYLKEDGTAATSADDAYYTYDVYAPNMDYAVLTASATVESSDKPVELHFQPAFTAFEVNITSADRDFTVSKVELVGASDRLAGTYRMKAGANLDTYGSVTVVESGDTPASNSVSLTMNAVQLTSTKGITFTLFTIPKANEGLLSLRITTSVGTATLALTDTDGSSAYQFRAGRKYRINLLKLGETWKYKIVLKPEDLPWDLVSEQTTFSQNIQAIKFDILNATETGNNYYPTGTKDYQIRTLDMSKDYGPGKQPYFLVTFTPQAPTGGYWQLIPEAPADDLTGLGTAAFKVEVWDDETDSGSTDLRGQIMSRTVTLHITCNVTDDQRNVPHSIIIKSLFSSSVSFDENATYSADSEIQDVHKDGSFSFWRFVIPQKTTN